MILFSNISKGLDLYHATPGAVLVDVREADEFASGHIPGAINAPLSTIAQTSLPQDGPLFLYCLRGARSKRAAALLKRKAEAVPCAMRSSIPLEEKELLQLRALLRKAMNRMHETKE